MQVDGLSGAYVREHGTSSQSALTVSQLTASDRIQLDLVIENARPLRGTIYVIFTTPLGTRAQLQVNIRLSIRTPLLLFTPEVLTANIVRGTQRVIDVRIQNTGEVPAENVRLDIPSDPRLSLVSFSTNETDANGNHVMSAGSDGSFSLAVTIASTESLGQLSGRIAVNTDLTTSYLSYTFYITSIRDLNLTVLVEDEYTYFATDRPLLAGATVVLSNPRRRYSETLETPASGTNSEITKLFAYIEIKLQHFQRPNFTLIRV